MTTMQYVAMPGLDNPRANATRELMNAANELEVLQTAYEHLCAFNNTVPDLTADTGCPKKTGKPTITANSTTSWNRTWKNGSQSNRRKY